MAIAPRDRAAEDALVSVAQAAALLGVHPNTIRNWTDAGRLTAYRINVRGDRRYRRGDVERLLAEGADSVEPAMPIPDAQRDGEMAVLARLAQGAAAASNTSAVCRVAVESIRSRFDYSRIAIYLARGGGLGLETHAGYRVAPVGRLEMSEEPGEPLVESTTTAERHPGSLTELRLPLRAAGETVGLLLISDEPGSILNTSHLPFLRTVGNAVAVAIHSAGLLTRARRELTRARALRSITQELTGKLDLNVVLGDVIDRTRSLFDAEKVGLWLVDDSDRPFKLASARGISNEFQAQVNDLSMDSPSLGVYAVRERRTFVVRDADSRGSVGIMRETYEREGIRTACIVPLVSHDRTVGILGLYHQRDHEWPEDELALAQAFANQAAVAISNARLYRSAAEQAARMQSIQDLSARLNRLTDVQAIADAIVTEASTLAEYHDIRIYTVDWLMRTCDPVAYTARLLGAGDFEERLKVDVGPGSFTGMVAETGEAMLINDALADERGHIIEGTDDIDESMLVVPMLYEQRAVGVLALSKLGINQFTDDDLQTMTIFAGYAAQAIANATAYERLEQQSTELARQLDSQRRLLEINEQLLGSLDHESVFELIADGLKSVVHYDNLSIYRADHAQSVLAPVLVRERHAEQVARYIVPFGHGLMGWAVDHRQAVMANDALADPRVMQIPGTPDDPEALIVVPLVSDGVVSGSLNISRVGGPEVYFSENDLELVKLFAGQASIALRNADTHHAVSLRAETDALTGLGNHGAFQRHLASAIDDMAADDTQRQPVSLLMMDLDNFKAHNDRLGHPAGDALLHAIGSAIQSAARANDRAYRYGGDEFVLILPGVEPVTAATIGERVRRAVARLTAKELSPVTITVGVASWPADADDKNALIAAADTALYYGKQAGEDRVVRATEVPREMRDLRGTLDQLARAALLRADEPRSVEHLVERAARLTGESEDAAVRDALLGVARTLDARGSTSRGQADRVGRLASTIAQHLGCDENDARNIELAARLHGLELVGTAEMKGIPSLAAIDEIMRWSRRSRATARSMPISAQIIAAANAYDVMTSGGGGKRLSRSLALEELRSQVRRFRPDVLEALATSVDERRGSQPGRRNDDQNLNAAAHMDSEVAGAA